MNRLTMESDKGGVALTFDLVVTCDKSEISKILKLAERLKYYEDLDEQGKLLKLPCTVGDKDMEKLMIEDGYYKESYMPKALCSIGRDGIVDDCDTCSEYCNDRKNECSGCAIHECFDRLGEYESTELTPEKIVALDEEYTKLSKELMEYRKIGTVEECREAVEKQRAKKALRRYTVGNVMIGDCPSCDMPVGKSDSYCHHCGQKLDWEDSDAR